MPYARDSTSLFPTEGDELPPPYVDHGVSGRRGENNKCLRDRERQTLKR